ncbi:MAG: hypothetical protein ACKV2T_16200 [Kofleriaceae bacterium]
MSPLKLDDPAELRPDGITVRASESESVAPADLVRRGDSVRAGFHAASIGRTNRCAQLQLVTQACHLRQLLPKGPT